MTIIKLSKFAQHTLLVQYVATLKS